MPNLLVLGDINADLAATLPSYPAEGDDVSIDALAWCSGGAAVNSATALALLGAGSGLIGRVGSDPAAEVALRAALRAGVGLGLVQRDAAVPTGLCLAAVSPGGQRTFFSMRGANTQLEPAALQPPDMAGVCALHICAHALLEAPQRQAALHAIELARAVGARLSLDLCLPAVHRCRELVLELLPAFGVLFMNEDELRFLLPGYTRDAALIELLARGATLVALKLGAQGCLVATRHTRLSLAAVTVEARDTNGCGDAFVAGFLWAHLRAGAGLLSCAALGNLLGGLTATRAGAADALPTRAELRALLAAQPEWVGAAEARAVLD